MTHVGDVRCSNPILIERRCPQNILYMLVTLEVSHVPMAERAASSNMLLMSTLDVSHRSCRSRCAFALIHLEDPDAEDLCGGSCTFNVAAPRNARIAARLVASPMAKLVRK